MHWLGWGPLCEPSLCVFLYSVLGVTSGPGVGLAGCGVLCPPPPPPVVCSAGRSGAVVPLLVLLFVALWFVLRGDLFYVLPCVILFLCFSVLLALRLPRLCECVCVEGGGGGGGGGRGRGGGSVCVCGGGLVLMLFMRLFGLCLFGFVGFLFLFLLVSRRAAVCDCGTPWTFLFLFFCKSLSLVWPVLHIFEYAALLDTELVSLRYALCFWCFSSRSPWISLSCSSNQSWCLRDTGPRESIAEEWMVSLKTVQLSSGSSERSSIASNRLHLSLMKACLLLSCFSLETSSLFGTVLPCWCRAG